MDFGSFTIGLDLTSFLALVFLIVFLVFLIYSIFLIFHWHAYGMRKTTNTLATIIYLAGSGLIVLVMVLSIAATI